MSRWCEAEGEFILHHNIGSPTSARVQPLETILGPHAEKHLEPGDRPTVICVSSTCSGRQGVSLLWLARWAVNLRDSV
jgi:hypothetical protein